MANRGRPVKNSEALRALLSVHDRLTDDEIIAVCRSTPGYKRAVKPREEKPVEENAYPLDPVEFMQNVLGYAMWPKLQQICESVQNNANTVVESGFGTGKSISAAAIACWFLVTRKPVVVITIAPTWSQVQSIIWRYIRSVGRKANLPGIIYETPRWAIDENCQAYGLSPRKSSDQDMASLQGRHEVNQLIVMDEAAGLPPRIWDTITGLSVGQGNRILAIGNPTQQAGPFYNACNSPHWNHIRISCFSHPNVTEGKDVIPGAVTRDWISSRADEWGYACPPDMPGAIEIPWDNRWIMPLPIFQAKVLGIAPEMSEDQLIHVGWVSNAEGRELETDKHETVIGLDPARHGSDSTAMCVRRGGEVLSIVRRKGMDTQQVAQWLFEVCGEVEATRAYIDEIGIGAGVLDRARVLGVPAIGVNFSRPANQKTRFLNVRAESWWRLREALRNEEMSLPRDPLLSGDLTAPRYSFDPFGRIVLESKDEIRARISRSPDSGDSLALTFSMPVQLDSVGLIDVEKLSRDLKSHYGTGGRASRWGISAPAKGSRWRR